MQCSHCQSIDSKVIESRNVAEGESIRRRRQCLNCEHRFTTYERPEQPNLAVVKKDGSRQLFDRTKLMAGLMRACEKTSVTAMQMEDLVVRIENKLYSLGADEVSTSKIGDFVMEELVVLDEIAYVRFASVYKNFQDIESFEKALSAVKRRAKSASTST